MDKIVIIGASGHAKVIIDIIEQEGIYEIAGLIDSHIAVGEKIIGYSVLGSDKHLPELIARHNLQGAIIGIGDNFNRSKVANHLAHLYPNLPFVSTVHPKAAIATSVLIGEGSVIMAGASINSCCSIGKFCVVNTNSSLDHDSVMEDFSSLAPGVAVGGNCLIGSHSAISIGANIIHGKTIGTHSIIGAGSTVLSDIPSFCVAYGTPAREIRKRNAGDKYL